MSGNTCREDEGYNTESETGLQDADYVEYSPNGSAIEEDVQPMPEDVPPMPEDVPPMPEENVPPMYEENVPPMYEESVPPMYEEDVPPMYEEVVTVYGMAAYVDYCQYTDATLLSRRANPRYRAFYEDESMSADAVEFLIDLIEILDRRGLHNI